MSLETWAFVIAALASLAAAAGKVAANWVPRHRGRHEAP